LSVIVGTVKITTGKMYSIEGPSSFFGHRVKATRYKIVGIFDVYGESHQIVKA
jgi:hypothetical protein